ncbi:phage major capsid protein [Methylobacterium oryzae CBMB20]
MPDLAKDRLSVAFGDFRRGYLVVDRTGMRVLREPYSAKPYVLFYTTKRVGGGVQDFDAIKLLKFSLTRGPSRGRSRARSPRAARPAAGPARDWCRR